MLTHLLDQLYRQEQVYQALWNAGEGLILTTSADGTARVWNAAVGKSLFTFGDDEDEDTDEESYFGTEQYMKDTFENPTRE